MKDIVTKKKHLRKLSWIRLSSAGWIGGSFLKVVDFGKKPFSYYKLSSYDSARGIVGHECINELIADRMLNILGISHVHYQLVNARIQLGSNENETPLEFCIRNGLEDWCYEMLMVDFLILNRDRHGANLEVVKNDRIRKLYPAPLFDHGLSLLFCCHSEQDIRNYNVLEDRPVQCFLGSHSAAENLKLIPRGKILE